MFRGLLALAVSILFAIGPASAQERWILLGSHEIDPSANEVLIDLDVTRPVKQLFERCGH